MIRTKFRTPHAVALMTLLLATAAAAQTADICFPEEYSVDRRSHLPAEMDVIVDKEWFSLAQQQVRNDFTVSSTQSARSYEDYSAKIRYIAIYEGEPPAVTSCSSTPFNDTLERNCIAFDALYRGDRTVGGALPVENYILPSTGDPNLIQFDYIVARLGSETLPLRFLARTVQASQALIEFVNYGFEVDPSVFDLPSECANAGASTESATIHLRDLLGAGRVEALSQFPRFRRLVKSPEGP